MPEISKSQENPAIAAFPSLHERNVNLDHHEKAAMILKQHEELLLNMRTITLRQSYLRGLTST